MAHAFNIARVLLPAQAQISQLIRASASMQTPSETLNAAASLPSLQPLAGVVVLVYGCTAAQAVLSFMHGLVQPWGKTFWDM